MLSTLNSVGEQSNHGALPFFHLFNLFSFSFPFASSAFQRFFFEKMATFPGQVIYRRTRNELSIFPSSSTQFMTGLGVSFTFLECDRRKQTIAAFLLFVVRPEFVIVLYLLFHHMQ